MKKISLKAKEYKIQIDYYFNGDSVDKHGHHELVHSIAYDLVHRSSLFNFNRNFLERCCNIVAIFFELKDLWRLPFLDSISIKSDYPPLVTGDNGIFYDEHGTEFDSQEYIQKRIKYLDEYRKTDYYKFLNNKS